MKLSDTDVTSRLAALPNWVRQGDALTRKFTFASFPDAIAFVTRLAFDAEAADHHPDLRVSYRKVTVTWSTHGDGGLTEKDFAGAQQSDMIAARSSPLTRCDSRPAIRAREVAALTGLTARQLQSWDVSRIFLSGDRAAAHERRRLHRTPVHAGRCAGAARACRSRGAAASRRRL